MEMLIVIFLMHLAALISKHKPESVILGADLRLAPDTMGAQAGDRC